MLAKKISGSFLSRTSAILQGSRVTPELTPWMEQPRLGGNGRRLFLGRTCPLARLRAPSRRDPTASLPRPTPKPAPREHPCAFPAPLENPSAEQTPLLGFFHLFFLFFPNSLTIHVMKTTAGQRSQHSLMAGKNTSSSEHSQVGKNNIYTLCTGVVHGRDEDYTVYIR